MSFVYNEFKKQLLIGGINLSTADVRVALVMSNTTADTEDDANTFADFTTLDECDGSGYARATLTPEAVTEDPTNNRAVFDAADASFPTLGAGTRQNVAAIVYIHNGALSSQQIPAFYIDDGGFPFTAAGATFVLQWSATGIATLT